MVGFVWGVAGFGLFFKGGFVEIRPWDSSTDLSENRAIISTQSPFTLSRLLYRFHHLSLQHLNVCALHGHGSSILPKNFNIYMRNLNFTLLLTSRKNVFIREQVQYTHRGNYFLHTSIPKKARHLQYGK